MLVVAIDTSTPAVTAALAQVLPEGVSVLGERVTVDGRAHAELLAPAIADLLAAHGAAPTDLAAVVAGVGPGPFTGLRVGLVTAAVLGQTLAVPTYGVCSLDAIGAAVPGSVLVATDARRKEVYWAVYTDGRRITEPAVNRPADVDAGPATHAVGDGARLYDLGLPLLEEPRYPRAEALVALAADRILARAPGEALTPLYLRRPDAVEPGARKLVAT